MEKSAITPRGIENGRRDDGVMSTAVSNPKSDEGLSCDIAGTFIRELSPSGHNKSNAEKINASATSISFAEDPHEVLRASLEFQRSSSLSQIGVKKNRQNRLILKDSSLYPSIECVNRADIDFDFEEDWHNAAVTSKKNETTYSSEVSASFLTSGRLLSSGIAEAEVLIVQNGTMHPREVESVVQAELVYQGEDDHEQDQHSHANHSCCQEATAASAYDEESNTVSSCELSIHNEVTTEATVIESGPSEKATIAAWSGDTTEAVVLQQENDANQFESIDDLDTKASSFRIDNEVANDSTSQRLCEQNQFNGGVDPVTGFDTGKNMIATVVDYNIHPSEMMNSVQAELIGNTSANDFVAIEVGMISSGNDNVRNFVDTDETERPTEATVLDSGPPDKATVHAWSSTPLEEAHVLRANYFRDVPFATEDEAQNIPSCKTASAEDMAVCNDGQAEIVEISENVHPVELELERATTAQLVRDNPNDIIPASGHTLEEDFVADAIVEETNETFAIHTMQSQVQILHEVDTQDATPATPATILAVESISSVDSSDDQNYPQKDLVGDKNLPSNELVTMDDNADLISTETSPSDYEIHSEYRQSTFPADDSLEGDLQIPQPRPFQSAAASQSTNIATSTRSTNTNRSESTLSSVQTLTKNISRGTNNVLEILFGNTKPSSNIFRNPVSFEMDSFTTSVSPRTLLPSSVIYSEATRSWVATLNTSQKALDAKDVEESSKALRAFSVPTMKQAMCLARAWAPPKMHPFASNLQCFICQSQFAVFRRACHCRNCGVCICSSCTVQWPAKMIPATYNTKNMDMVNICKACDWLCSAFRLALLKGESDKAIALHATGNINLTTPFANIKGEVFYPVHCAVLGKSLSLLKWLVDENCCPLKSIRIGSGGRRARSDCYTPILTSKSRSLFNIALANKNIDIMRYLVVEKGILLHEERDLPMDLLLHTLDSILRILPADTSNQQASNEASDGLHGSDLSNSATATQSEISSLFVSGSIDKNSNVKTMTDFGSEVSPGSTTSNEQCILCCSNPIDSVVMPCGHQMCCLECSKNISRCPICNCECSFVRVYRA